LATAAGGVMCKMECETRERLVAGVGTRGKCGVMARRKVVNEGEFWSFLGIFWRSLEGFKEGPKRFGRFRPRGFATQAGCSLTGIRCFGGQRLPVLGFGGSDPSTSDSAIWHQSTTAERQVQC
jgi:hypothetical protein